MMFDRDYHFVVPGAVSVSSVCEDAETARAVRESDWIRHETLRRLCAIPSYPHKSLDWKNRYYDVIRRQVMAEAGMIC